MADEARRASFVTPTSVRRMWPNSLRQKLCCGLSAIDVRSRRPARARLQSIGRKSSSTRSKGERNERCPRRLRGRRSGHIYMWVGHRPEAHSQW